MGNPGLHKRYSNSEEMLFYSECLELKRQKGERRKAWGVNRISGPGVKAEVKAGMVCGSSSPLGKVLNIACFILCTLNNVFKERKDDIF